MDHRVFFEALSDRLHEKNEKRIGKIITNDRFDRLVRACGLPPNDPTVTRSEREAIACNRYVAGVDGRLFAWKPGHEKDDIATVTWPTDMANNTQDNDNDNHNHNHNPSNKREQTQDNPRPQARA